MGGRDTIKGVKAQGMVAVLESLLRDDWKVVRIEPEKVEGKADKIDIQWDLNDGKCRIAQVKSSENPIQKSSLKTYLNDLIQENPSADAYDLHIIGPLTASVHEFVNQVNNGTLIDSDLNGYPALKRQKSSSKIIVKGFDFVALEAMVYKLLHEFYDRKGIVGKATEISVRTKALLNDFDILPILNKPLTKKSLEDKLAEWTDKFAIGNLDLNERQLMKESLQNLEDQFRALTTGLYGFPHDTLREKVSRLNHYDAYSKAFTVHTVQSRYLKILNELETYEKKRESMLKLKAQYEEAKHYGTRSDNLKHLANLIDKLSVEIEEGMKNSRSFKEFIEFLEELNRELY
ncbi:hypothetical protein J2W98_004687 [Paenibacillus peoriae]|uniref:Restriction endonuclease type IV Mrr domain-containing protein n=1 Tax=Paenibacillus peoriae TaxID=59893 RepID=A0ABU1QLD1_9BACL|nr:hypothetical protein [Paenibacillus peoriae]MDR6780392.1 hypothetical protein [Paenibacillus peoriae]